LKQWRESILRRLILSELTVT